MISVSGQQHFNAAADKVYSLVTNPATFERHIAGCQTIKPAGVDGYLAQVVINAMGLRINQKIEITLEDRVPAQACSFVLSAKSQFGNADSRLRLELTADATGTNLQYAGSATVTGLLASVGPRLIEVSVKRMLDEFFAKLATSL